MNISTRGRVETGDNVMIGGVIVAGRLAESHCPRDWPFDSVTESCPIRRSRLHDGNGALIDSNDNWRSDQEAEIILTGLPPSNDLESAIVANLPPANYTAIVRGRTIRRGSRSWKFTR